MPTTRAFARSLVGPAAFTLYRVGAVKQAGDTRYVAIDGGMSDNPRPQLYGARYSALLANRADETPADGHFTIADAMFAPVATRFVTYGVDLDATCRAYVDAVYALPAMKDWLADAVKEPKSR